MTGAPENLARTVLRDPVHILAFGFGTGLSPVAPGTVGSLVGVLFAWLTLDLGLPLQLAVAALISVAGIWICGESARRIGVHDHGGIVWDEIAGMYITLLAAPPTIAAWVLGFVLFRVFDIAKPWPILGIMLDDLAAALYALILLGLYGWLMT
jgi:phosphatidylglycerophosphatase A